MTKKARLPYGKQFSPAQTRLKDLVRLIIAHAGNRTRLEAAIAKTFHSGKAQSGTLAMNTFLSARSYGLLEGDNEYQPSALAEELDQLNEAAAHERLAEEILTKHQGLTVLQVVRARASRAEPMNKQGIADDLANHGVDSGGHRGENLSALRQWLEAGGVLEGGWKINEAAVKKVLGPTMSDLDALLGLPLEHRAFLRALATMTGKPPFDSQAVAKTADTQSGTRLRDLRNLPSKILAPLEAQGWIISQKTTSGRGAKPTVVTPTRKFKAEISRPLADAIVQQAQLGDPASLRRPLQALLAEVRNKKLSAQSRGQSLEGVAIHLIRLLGARFLDWRRRGPSTGYAEVDVLADLVNGRYQLIQLQAKVSSIKTRDIIDREMGVAACLRSNIVIFISAETIGDGPRRAADEHMADTNISILFVDGGDLDALATGKKTIADLLDREFAHVGHVKHVQRDMTTY